MPSKKINIYIIVSIFSFTAVFGLALILNHNRLNSSINDLVASNENLSNEFNIETRIQNIESNILNIESKIRGWVTTQDSSHLNGVSQLEQNIKKELLILQKISENEKNIQNIELLEFLIIDKLKFSKQIIEINKSEGEQAAKQFIASNKGKVITENILATTNKIKQLRRLELSRISTIMDENGKNALWLNKILLILFLIPGTLLAWLVVRNLNKQHRLIKQLNESENKLKITAKIKENFLANMSHEIRTPMNAIIGFTNLLQRSQLDDKSKEYVETIHKSSENLLAIVNDILDLSKMEAGMMRIESYPFSIRAIIQNITSMFATKAIENGITLSCDVDKTIPNLLIGDATRLSQILVNVIGNAVKFTDKGSVTLEVKNIGINIDKTKVDIEIVVADTGVGIEKEKLKSIFERFQQVDDESTRKYGGTGLGLTIVKELIYLLDGTITVKSELGLGTIFSMRLPYKIAVQDNKNNTLSNIPEVEKNIFVQKRILIVEDNPINQKLIQHLFEEKQINYSIANNGQEAIDLFLENDFAMILMDIQLPIIDGYKATEIIRQRYKSNIPIVAMTAHAMQGEKEKCMSYGMNDYLSKPIDVKILFEMIHKYAGSNFPLSTVNDNGNSEAPYKYIDLHYLKELSDGDKTFEYEITQTFIEVMEEEINKMNLAIHNDDKLNIAAIAHSIKSTVSAVGLVDKLKPALDILENESLSHNDKNAEWLEVKKTCDAAITEAKQHLFNLNLTKIII